MEDFCIYLTWYTCYNHLNWFMPHKVSLDQLERWKQKCSKCYWAQKQVEPLFEFTPQTSVSNM